MAWHKLKPETKTRLAAKRKAAQQKQTLELKRRLRDRSNEARRNGEDDIWIDMLLELP